MKNIIVTAFFLTGIFWGQAQVKTPQLSVASELETTVGLTTIEIDYSRPSMRGRTVFGNIVPYGKRWRTGANANTTISFSDDVVIGGQTLKAGKYGLFTLPGKETWEIYFYSENDNWGNQVKWNPAKVAAKVTAKVQHLAHPVETFLISIGDLTNDTAELNLMWDKVKVSTLIHVPTDQKVMASIQKTMKGTPSARDYMAAAGYYFTTGKDAKQAMEWMDKGMAMNERQAYYQIYQQAAIHQKAGDTKGALALAKKALAAAEKSGDAAYIRKSKKALQEWGK